MVDNRAGPATAGREPDAMFRVCKEIEFCYGHRLLEHAGKCKHLHGHNARAVVVLESDELDGMGMVCDFAEVDRAARSFIDAELDHTMLLRRDDPFLPRMREAGERVYVMDLNPTAENIARLILEKVAAMGLPVVEVQIWESGTACASYRPPR